MRRLVLAIITLSAFTAAAQEVPYAPDRHEGEGPFQRLIIRVGDDDQCQALRFEEGAAPGVALAVEGVDTAFDLDSNCQHW